MRTKCCEGGFTLVELLVVMTVIGLLAAVAVPTFLSQRQRAVEATLAADLRTVAQLMETYYVDEGSYVGDLATLHAAIPPPTLLSPGNDLELVAGETSSSAFCLRATNPRATTTHYDSDGGGLLAPGVPCT